MQRPMSGRAAREICCDIHTLGPKETPPPGRSGVRLLPIRALPVPFWAYGFLPPPRTSARVFVLAVPCADADRNVKTGDRHVSG